MTPYGIYVLIVSIVVIVALTVFFSLLIWYIYLLTMRLIYVGYWDQQLASEYEYEKRPKPKGTVAKVLAAIICGVLSIVALFSVFLGIAENRITSTMTTLRVVKSASMSEKYKENDYLFNHSLDNQIQTFDIIITFAPPAEEDIQLYDVIVYEKNGELIIHRVVYIAEPTEEGDGRLFYTRGDANKKNDTMPVEYSQIRGIYREERIPFVGSFVLFMQSPAGIICLILAIFCMIIMPIVDNKIADARSHRYRRIHTGLATIRTFYKR